MKCNHCGTEFEAKFCPECGARAKFGSTQPEQQAPQPVYQTEVKSKKKKKTFFLILLTIVAVVGVIAFIGNTNKNKPNDNTTESTTVITTKGEPTTENTPVEADSPEALEAIIMAYVEGEIELLNTEYATLISEITSYDKYVEKLSDVEAFYKKVVDTSYRLTVKMCEYSIEYAELLLDSKKSASEIYDELDGIFDCIYEDASDEIYDGIYNGILSDMFDDLYSGVVSDGIDSVSYSEWSDVSSDAYRMWSDSGTDCYRHWSDMSSAVYRFWSDLSEDIFSGKVEEAEKTAEDFKADVEEMKKSVTASSEVVTENTTKATTTETTTTQLTTTEKPEDLVDGMRPEFKAAMDSYETFMTDYVDFMKKFEENPSDLSILADYADYMKKYADFVEDFEEWDDEEMNNAEMAYYIDVQARVSKKLLEVSE